MKSRNSESYLFDDIMEADGATVAFVVFLTLAYPDMEYTSCAVELGDPETLEGALEIMRKGGFPLGMMTFGDCQPERYIFAPFRGDDSVIAEFNALADRMLECLDIEGGFDFGDDADRVPEERLDSNRRKPVQGVSSVEKRKQKGR